MAKEFIWGCELNADNPCVTWDMLDISLKEDISNFNFTLLMKSAIIGSTAQKDEVNVVELETMSITAESIQQPLFRLSRGGVEQMTLDLMVSHAGSKFRLIEGRGPVYLWGQHLVEWAEEGDSRLSMPRVSESNVEASSDIEVTSDIEEEEQLPVFNEPSTNGTKKRSSSSARDGDRSSKEGASDRNRNCKSKFKEYKPESCSEDDNSESVGENESPPEIEVKLKRSKSEEIKEESSSESDASEPKVISPPKRSTTKNKIRETSSESDSSETISPPKRAPTKNKSRRRKKKNY